MDNPSQSIIEPSSAAMATRSARRITVVIPCFNAEKRVGRAIQSVIDQECPKTPWFDVALWHKV